MDQNENLSNLIKKEANTSLNFYNKIIPETKLTVKDLIDKASEIEKKLSNNKNNLDNSENELIHSNSKHRETINNSINNNNNNQYIEYDQFRKQNNFIPKIHINRSKEKTIINRDDIKYSFFNMFANENNTIFHPKNSSCIDIDDNNNNNDDNNQILIMEGVLNLEIISILRLYLVMTRIVLLQRQVIMDASQIL